jgi:hypothetical protein
MRNPKLHKLSIVYICTFFMLLVVPTLVMVFKSANTTSCEQRTILKRPIFNYQLNYLKQFGAYFEDNYGFRNELTYCQSVIKLTVFNSSTNPKQVLIGKEGWLFYNSKTDQAYGSYSRTNLLTSKELRSYKTLHEERKQLLASQSIHYLLAVFPDKCSIYPEHFPFQMKVQVSGKTSRTDQIRTYLKKQQSPISLIEVRKEMLTQKQQQLYVKHDSHWNDLGAYYAYFTFMQKAYAVLQEKPHPLTDFTLTSAQLKGGDLLGMLGICAKSNYTEPIPILQLKQKMKLSDDKEFSESYGKHNATAPSKLKVLFFRDSYGNALIQYFSLHFNSTYFYWTAYDQSIVDKVKPDVVVVMSTERYV